MENLFISGASAGSGSDSGVRASVIRATTDSPMSPPASGSSAPAPPLALPLAQQAVLAHTSIYTTPR